MARTHGTDRRDSSSGAVDPGLTLKSFLLGAGAIALISLLLQQVTLALGGPDLNEWAPPAGPVVLLGLLALLLSGLRGLLPWLRLSRGELVVIYCMACVGSLLSGTGLVHRLLPGLVTNHFMYAEPGTWYYPFLKYIPAWFGPAAAYPGAVDEFFAPTGAGVPWGAWLLPLAAWSVLICSLFFAMLCAVILLRRQWTETENLNFPIVQLPLALIGGEAAGGAPGGLLRNRLTWIGFAVSALLLGYNGLTRYVQALTPVSLELDFANFLVEKPWSAMTLETMLPSDPFLFSVSPLMIGIAYLFPLNTLLSVWLFFLLTRLQLLGAELTGLSQMTASNRLMFFSGARQFPFFSSQAQGGIYVLIIFMVWSARSHLRELAGKAFRFRQGRPGREEGEPFSAGFTVWGLSGALGICVIWAHMAGLGIGCGLAFFLLFLILALAFARMRAEAGVPFTYELLPVPFLIYMATGTGPAIYSASDYQVLSHLNMLCAGGFGMLMVILFESYKMGQAAAVPAPRMTLALVLAFALGLVTAFWTSLTAIYTHGLQDMGSGNQYAAVAFYHGREVHHTVHWAYKPQAAAWLNYAFEGIGFAVTAALAVLRRLFSHWPLHPIGFVVGTGFGYKLWSSVLIAWAIKSTMLRYGGVRLYQKALPAFLGLALGHLAMEVFWTVVALSVGSAGS